MTWDWKYWLYRQTVSVVHYRDDIPTPTTILNPPPTPSVKATVNDQNHTMQSIRPNGERSRIDNPGEETIGGFESKS